MTVGAHDHSLVVVSLFYVTPAKTKWKDKMCADGLEIGSSGRKLVNWTCVVRAYQSGS